MLWSQSRSHLFPTFETFLHCATSALAGAAHPGEQTLRASAGDRSMFIVSTPLQAGRQWTSLPRCSTGTTSGQR
ncbi:hypothetical protein SBRY_50348 [Actinacidiphila bryophytorum]|uniref:Uncharacterized protein n=1 Tax=Actinacidiphila bryophytorum TaxID=1436133 RepID=A0A9W4MD61_9ACTN|nr:hypothetical protein SBRY_50348 [Actinacidiphila bryophytorum]